MTIDQLTKFLAPGFGFAIELNGGASFGSFNGISVWVLVVVLIGMVWWLYNTLPPGILGLFAGSAVSNISDRVLFGGVRDWIPLQLGPISLNNNLADWMLCAAVLASVVQFAHGERQKHTDTSS